jgi:hypothetical protein
LAAWGGVPSGSGTSGVLTWTIAETQASPSSSAVSS